MQYVVITENDESQWHDQTGSVYHFPKRYRALLEPGALVIYYKGKMTNRKYQLERKSRAPHYFASATIGAILPDKQSSKGDLFALVENFVEFDDAVLAKVDGVFFETIPPNRAINYWRDGVREISQSDYERILSLARPNVSPSEIVLTQPHPDSEMFESMVEGKPGLRYGTIYERNRKLRNQAIAIHGTACAGCGFNFESVYGEIAKGFIHIHHTKPLSEEGKEHHVDPQTDLVPLCPNCHSVVHLQKTKTLSLDELKAIMVTR